MITLPRSSIAAGLVAIVVGYVTLADDEIDDGHAVAVGSSPAALRELPPVQAPAPPVSGTDQRADPTLTSIFAPRSRRAVAPAYGAAAPLASGQDTTGYQTSSQAVDLSD